MAELHPGAPLALADGATGDESLGQVQRHFIDAITGPARGRGAPAWPACDAVCARDGAEAEFRLSIYRAMVDSRLHDVLAEDFPRVRALAGDESFERVVRDYLRRHPPSTPTIASLGGRFPDFLDDHEISASCPHLGDLARLDRARNEVFDAADDVTLALEGVSELLRRNPEARVRLVSASAFVETSFHIEAAWAAADSKTGPGPADVGRDTFLVWRLDHVVRHRRIPDEERDALALLRQAVSLGDLCSVLAEGVHENPAERAFVVLQQWTVDGLLAL
jgi:hypothetical protein